MTKTKPSSQLSWRSPRTAIKRVYARYHDSVPLVLISSIFTIILTWLFTNALVNPQGAGYRNGLALVIAACIGLGLLVSLPWVNRLASYLRSHKRAAVYGLVIGMVLLLGWQAVLGYAAEAKLPTWDVGPITEHAIKAATQGGPIITSNHIWNEYFIRYQNNIGLFILLTTLFKVVSLFGHHGFLFAAMLLNAVVLNLTILVILLTSRKLGGMVAAIYAGFFSIILIGFSQYVAVTYTDTLSVLFPISIFYLYLHVREAPNIKRKLFLTAFISAVAALGFLLKPTIFIILIAIALSWIMRQLGHLKDKQQWLRGAALSIVFLGIFSPIVIGFRHYAISYSGLFPFTYQQSQRYNMPLTHWIAMGMSGKHGGYNSRQVVITDSLITTSARDTYARQRIVDQLRNYGVTGYLTFINNKAIWVVSDGSFASNYYIGSPPIHHDDFSRMLQRFISKQGSNTGLYLNILCATWLAVLAVVCLTPLLQLGTLGDPNLNILRLALSGLLTYILIFEGNPRYIFHFLAVFIVLAAVSLRYWQISLIKDASTIPKVVPNQR